MKSVKMSLVFRWYGVVRSQHINMAWLLLRDRGKTLQGWGKKINLRSYRIRSPPLVEWFRYFALENPVLPCSM